MSFVERFIILYCVPISRGFTYNTSTVDRVIYMCAAYGAIYADMHQNDLLYDCLAFILSINGCHSTTDDYNEEIYSSQCSTNGHHLYTIVYPANLRAGTLLVQAKNTTQCLLWLIINQLIKFPISKHTYHTQNAIIIKTRIIIIHTYIQTIRTIKYC